MLGFVIQLLAIVRLIWFLTASRDSSEMRLQVIESFRIVLIQILLQSWNLSPLVSLYYFAPVGTSTVLFS